MPFVVWSASDPVTAALPIPATGLVVGRSPDCHIVLPSPRVSARHLELRPDGNGVLVTDLGSSSGTFVAGKRIESPTRASLPVRVGVGPCALCVAGRADEIVAAPAAASAAPAAASAAVPSSSSSPSSPSVDWKPLAELVDLLRRAGTPRTLLGHLLSGLVNLLGARRGFVLVRPSPGEPLVPVAEHVAPDCDVEELIAVSRTVYGQALATATTILVEDSRHSLQYGEAESLRKADALTILAAPLLDGGTPFGVIYLDRPFVLGPPWRDATLVNAVTGLAAQLLQSDRVRRELLDARSRLAAGELAGTAGHMLFGDGEAGQRLRSLVDAVAQGDATVLVTGETGTGKEMVAHALHARSLRAHGPFVAVNCAGLPRSLVEAELFGVERGAFTGAEQARPGRFELARGGTLFLDEVGEIPLDAQVMLLRVLEERTVTRVGGTTSIPLDIRLVAATNVNLEEAVAQGLFRRDLFYRLNVFPLPLAPLRERRDEIMPLARHFLSELSSRMGRRVEGFDDGASRALVAHGWPGNVRELRNVVERAILLERGPRITALSLPLVGTVTHHPEQSPATAEGLPADVPRDYTTAREWFERRFIDRCLEEHGGNVSAAARASGIPRSSFYYRKSRLEG